MSGYLVPLLFAAVILVGLIKRVDVYEAFAEGAAEGLPVLLKILPYLAAMMIAVRLLRDGGVLEGLTRLLAPLCGKIGVDATLVPLIFLRPFSGSASMAVLKEILSDSGPDSPAGRTASILMGSSETIFYEAALYFGVVGVKKTRFAIPVSLLAMLVSTVAALLLGRAG